MKTIWARLVISNSSIVRFIIYGIYFVNICLVMGIWSGTIFISFEMLPVRKKFGADCNQIRWILRKFSIPVSCQSNWVQSINNVSIVNRIDIIDPKQNGIFTSIIIKLYCYAYVRIEISGFNIITINVVKDWKFIPDKVI